MTTLYILAGLAVAVMVGLFGLALCRAARMGDEAMEAYIRGEAGKGEGDRP